MMSESPHAFLRKNEPVLLLAVTVACLLVYRLLFLHALILIVGAHYTYERVPLGLCVKELCDLSRNHYDRLGHFAQGFVPALLAREILLRRSPLVPGKWLFVLVVSGTPNGTCSCAWSVRSRHSFYWPACMMRNSHG